MRTIRHPGARTAPLWALLVAAPNAMACPVCHTETGKKVRAGIFNEEFGSNAAMTLLPFLILISVVAVIHFGPPAWMTALRRRLREFRHTTTESESL